MTANRSGGLRIYVHMPNMLAPGSGRSERPPIVNPPVSITDDADENTATDTPL
jgi:hypothetical protein